MKIYKFIIILIFLITVSLSAADAGDFSNLKPRVYGMVVDKSTNAPLEGATLQLFKLSDSTLAGGTVTGPDGKFEILDISPGVYFLKASYIGYSTGYVNRVVVERKGGDVELGILKLEQGSEEITEIEVTAERSFMENKIDKKVFNVEKSIVTESGSVIDVLKTIPSVTVDNDNKVYLRGNANIRFLINGKPSGMLGIDPSTMLDQLPADMVESIEIMNNPSAKYDAEGMGGIINVVLKSEKKEGYTGTVNINAGNKNRYNLGANLTLKRDNYSFSGNYNFRYFTMTMSGYTNRASDFNNLISYLNQNISMSNRMKGHTGGISFEYVFNPKNTLTFNSNFNYRDRLRNGTTESITSDINKTATDIYRNYGRDSEDGYGADFSLYYYKKFDKKKEELTASVQYTLSNEDETEYNVQQLYNPDWSITNIPAFLKNNYQKDNNYNFVLQADYTHPFDENSKYDIGYKSTVRRIKSDYNADSFSYAISNWVPNISQSNNFIYNEQVHSAYGTYENKYKNFGFMLGLRLEQTLTKSEQITQSQDFKNDYLSLFPSVFLTQGLGKGNELQFSYTRRINRPNTRILNPFIDYSDPQNLRGGNPYIKPEFINAFEISYAKYFTTASVTSSLFYRRVNDVISRYMTVNDSGIAFHTFKNVSQADIYGTEVIATGNFAKWLSLNASFSYFRTELKGDIDASSFDNSGYSWTSKIMTNLTFPKIFDVQIMFNYQGKNVTPQGNTEPFYSLDMALKRDFFDKRFSITLRVSDIFNNQKFAFNSSGIGYTQTSERRRDSRMAFLTLTYKFGDLERQKPKRTQTRENRENQTDDLDF